ncbi:MAG: hypothetical protein A3F10_01440 [Coxiella sp. RIFCSPHIGHO2_12_FULL_42_15]|nr:MAG: hypothetical protein A3F10_01440 [Coxiella sp. RIFCSPHIGHO2_12_FULL_42_15]
MSQISRYRTGRDLISQLHNDFNRLLSPFEQKNLDLLEMSASEWIPTIDIQEEDMQYIVHADVPGVKPSDIEISMENAVLTIRGKRKTEIKEKEGSFLRVERCMGSFLRQLTLPESVDEKRIEAGYCDGVLRIRLPKMAKGKEHKIQIKSER